MPDYLSIKDAARRMGVKPKEIRRRIKDGELEGFVRLPGGAFGGAEDAGGFGPAAPNRRAAPPPEREVHVQRLEETVMVLQSELNARRQEVEELHVLLREIKDGLTAQAAAATAGSTADVESAPAAVTAPTPEAAAAAPAEPEIDWSAYDAESEQLRATMGRLEALLEQLEAPEPELEAEPEPEAAPEPVHEAAPLAAAASLVTAVPLPSEPVPPPPPASTTEPPAPDRARPATKTAPSTATGEGDDAPTPRRALEG